MRFALILSLLLAIVAVLFALQNTEMVTIQLFGYQITSQLAIVLITTMLSGVVIGVLAGAPSRLAASARARRAEKQIAELEAARGEAAAARAQAAAARGEAASARSDAHVAAREADETQRLADEVARRTADVHRPPPPPAEPLR